MPTIVVRRKTTEAPKQPVEHVVSLAEYMNQNIKKEFTVESTVLSEILCSLYNIEKDGRRVGYIYIDSGDIQGGVFDHIQVIDMAFKDEAERLASAYEKKTGCESIAIFVPE